MSHDRFSPSPRTSVESIVEFFQQSFEIGIPGLMLDDPHDRSSLSVPYRSRKELLSVRDIARPPLYSRPSILLGRMKFFRTYLENRLFHSERPDDRISGKRLRFRSEILFEPRLRVFGPLSRLRENTCKFGKPASTNQSPFAGNPRAAGSSCFQNASPYRSTTPRPRHRCFPR